MAPPSPPPSPAATAMQQPPSDNVSLTPLAGSQSSSTAAAAQNPSLLHGTMASLNLTTATPAVVDGDTAAGGSCSRTSPAPAPKTKKKKSRKDENSIWTRPARKRKPKTKPSTAPAATAQPPSPVLGAEEYAAGEPVLLSRVFKSERIELSADRLGAASCKGYRMVRATHGVAAGAWYFEVKVLHLGPTGHALLGWATSMADIDMPVGSDEYGFGYRDVDGAKVHRAWRNPYGDEGYGEGDVLGFYISLPDGERYEPQVVFNNKGKPFLVQQGGQDAVASVPGSEIRYFKNGVCQGLAFKEQEGDISQLHQCTLCLRSPTV